MVASHANLFGVSSAVLIVGHGVAVTMAANYIPNGTAEIAHVIILRIGLAG